jgi:septal ring factor EnvC (AmiA/AmiB activator)
VLVGLALGTFAVGSPSDEQASARAELAALSRRIGELTRELNAVRLTHGHELAALRRIELRRAALSEQARDIATRIRAHELSLEALEVQARASAATLAARRAKLASHTRVAYASLRRGPLQYLLGQARPETLSRALALHGRVLQVQVERLEALERARAELASVRAALDAESAALDLARTDAARADASLAEEQARRAQIIDTLGAQLREGDSHIELLRADAGRLQRLLRELHQELEDLPFDQTGREPFAPQRGALPWPVAGRVSHRFGTSRGPDLRWQGVLIDSPAGRQVRAVAGGRVAYADWLRGFGLLLIIEHGEGYMTLYGRNESLFKEVGDWVETGEPIAVVGDSGGADGAGLYFEIRHRGEPQDPLAWVAPGGPR